MDFRGTVAESHLNGTLEDLCADSLGEAAGISGTTVRTGLLSPRLMVFLGPFGSWGTRPGLSVPPLRGLL